MPLPVTVRPATPADWPALWAIFRTVVAAGDSYAFAPDTPEDEARAFCLGPGVVTFVAVEGERLLGFYELRANQPGLGDHVANAGFMVDPGARGRGLGRLLGEHALAEAARLGFRAMQFNYVVSTNTAAVALWRRLGFAAVGRIPLAFRHRELGPVDVLVMHRHLADVPDLDRGAEE